MVTSYSCQTCFKQKKLYILSLVAYHSEIWYLETYFVAHCSHCIKKVKNRNGSSNDDVINSKAMIKRYTFSSILHVLWPVTLEFGILGSVMLMMTKKLYISFKKVKYLNRLCNDDVIIVPDMLHRDIQLYSYIVQV